MLAPTVEGDIPVSRVIFGAVRSVSLALGETERALFYLFTLSVTLSRASSPKGGARKGAVHAVSLPQRGRWIGAKRVVLRDKTDEESP